MLRLLTTVTLVVLFCSPASAGKNAGGALVVHAADGINNTMFPPPDYCEVWAEIDISRCEELDHQSDFVDPNFLVGELVWVVVALPEDSSPGVSVVYFWHRA